MGVTVLSASLSWDWVASALSKSQKLRSAPVGHGIAAPPPPVPSIWDLDALFCFLGGGTRIPLGFGSWKRLTGVPPATTYP